MSRKRLFLIIHLVLGCYFISQTFKFNHRSPKTSIDLLILEAKFNQTIIDFSGEYEELPSKQPFNTSIGKYTIENIYFLLTTNTARIRYTMMFLKFWSNIPRINCLIVFEENDLNQRDFVRYHIENNHIPCRIVQSNIRRFEERYFQLLDFARNILQEKNHSNIEWFAIGDDDTLWFIDNLLHTLEQYNSSELIYLGNTSDRNETIRNHGTYYAYGGGGILLSKSLIIQAGNSFEVCRKKYRNMFGGDEMIGKCFTEILKVNLTINDHFHQIDHEGDMEGLFQSGIDGLVTLHHLFILWEPFPPEHLEAEIDILNLIALTYQRLKGDYLKRFFRINLETNQTLLFTYGYSLTVYNRILTREEFDQIESTWTRSHFYGRKTRPKDKNKFDFFFKQFSSHTSDTGLYQYYQEQIEIRLMERHFYPKKINGK